MRTRIGVLCATTVLTAVACSVVDDGKVERFDPQFGLDDTLPSTSALSTTTTLLQTTTSGIETTTTQVATELVQLYFVDSGRLTPVFQPLAFPVSLTRVILALQAGPPTDETGGGFRNIVPNDIVIEVRTNGSGVASVTLPDGFFDLIEGSLTDQRLVIAQLVLTLTSRPGIGQVVFNVAVPLPSGQQRLPGQLLSFSDYAIYTSVTPEEGSEVLRPTTTTTTTTEG